MLVVTKFMQSCIHDTPTTTSIENTGKFGTACIIMSKQIQLSFAILCHPP